MERSVLETGGQGRASGKQAAERWQQRRGRRPVRYRGVPESWASRPEA